MSTADLASLVSRLEAVVERFESKAAGGGDAGSQVSARFVDDYDAFVEETIVPYLKASEAIGDVVDEQAKLLKAISDELRKFLLIVAKCSAPKDQAVLAKLVEPIGAQMGKMDGLKNKLDRKSNLSNHVRAASEGILMFAWVSIPKTPMKQVKDSKETAMFYTNKVLTEFKSSADAQKHKTWVATYLQIFENLRDYIKEHHTTGPSWNSKGSPATPGSATSAGGPPAPPPPPSALPTPSKSSAPSAGAVSDLLKDINKGTDVTKGLKKVTNDMKTHKNPELRKHHVPVPFKAQPTSYKPMGKSSAAQAPAKPPKLALEGKKWIVEYQDKANLTLDKCEMKQTIYIYKCNNCTITVTDKVNSIVLDTCKKTGLVFSSVVSGVEVVNCQSVQLQAQGQLHIVSVDKTDGFNIFLSEDCLTADIVTAKSSEMNVSIPNADGEYSEYPIVEQFRTTWNAAKKTLETVPSEQMG